MHTDLFLYYLESPVGFLQLQADNEFLLSLTFVEQAGTNSEYLPEVMRQSIAQLNEYFSGARHVFNLKLKPHGTDFQKKVWALVCEVTFGQTASYLDIARKTGSEKNARAVGMANGKNPIPIIIPCHRIIGTNKKLTGYAGGVERKRYLLSHELQFAPHKHQLF